MKGDMLRKDVWDNIEVEEISLTNIATHKGLKPIVQFKRKNWEVLCKVKKLHTKER